MNTTIKMTLAAALAAAALAPAATAASLRGEGVSIVYISSLDSGANRALYSTLSDKAQHPGLTEEAQVEASSDPVIANELDARQIALHNVVQIDTAANGGKIVYVR